MLEIRNVLLEMFT